MYLCRWKQTVSRKIHQLESTIESFREHLRSDQRLSTAREEIKSQEQRPDEESAQDKIQLIPLHVSSTPNQEDVPLDMDSGPATIPASSLGGNDISKDNDSTCGRGAYCLGDVIVDGIVTELQAKRLFNDYSCRLDHYLYRILGSSVTLDGIRFSSPTLLCAICAVAALHSVELGSLYEPCYQRFANLAANLALAENANMNDIRGLCIGAFWLHRLSWNLASLGMALKTSVTRAGTDVSFHISRDIVS